MTDEHKTNLLDYVVGNLDEGTSNDNLTITDDIKVSDTTITNNNGTRLKDSSGNYNGLVLSGYENEINGYMINDYEGNLIDTITTYDSGDAIDIFDEIYVEDDGKLFVITSMTSSTHPKEIIMLNNPSIKNSNGEYYFHIRKAYDISSYLPQYYTCWRIEKSPNESLYAISLQNQYMDGTTPVTDSGLLTCKIQVGAENEYTTYYGAVITKSGLIPYQDSIIKFNSDGEIDYTVLLKDTFSLQTDPKLYIYHKSYTDTTLSLSKSMSVDINSVDAIFYDEDTVMGMHYVSEDSTYTTYYSYFNMDNGTIKHIDKLADGTLNNFDISFKISDLVVIPVHDETNENNYIWVFRGKDRLAKKEYQNSYTLNETIFIGALVYNNYNLYNIISYLGDKAVLNQFVYNVNNYNGDSYISETMFVPESAILSNSEKMIFARNLYNRVLQQTTITSTLQIPNRYLNDETIVKEELIGENNNVIDENNETITKNIYEEILLNFNDTINIVNNNDDADIINQTGSVQLCNALLSGNSYDNIKMTKYRMVFADNSTIIRPLPTPTLVDTDIYQYEIVVASLYGQELDRIEFISEDGTLIYLTLTPTIEVDKVYKIEQKVRVN